MDAPETHTPTPWMTQPCGELLPDDVMIVADRGKTDNGIEIISTVARCLSVRQAPEVTKANAEFIVMAVNSHAALAARVAELEAENAKLRESANALIATFRRLRTWMVAKLAAAEAAEFDAAVESLRAVLSNVEAVSHG